MKPVLLITGAAHGLGRALALGAARDYKLALLDRERVAGEQLADALRRDGAEVLFVHADVPSRRTGATPWSGYSGAGNGSTS